MTPEELQKMPNADWLQFTLDAIATYRDLPPNWNGYRADQISQATIDHCGKVLESLSAAGWAKPNLTPTVDGGIALWWGDEERTIEVYANREQTDGE